MLTSQPLASGILTGKYGKDTVFAPGDNRSGFWSKERFASIQKDMEIVSSCVKAPADTMALLALAYDLSYPGISCVIPGAKNVAQVEKNAAASGIRLDQETMDRLMQTEGFVF